MNAIAERLTLYEFYQAYEGRRAYLINGKVFEMPPPNPPHVFGVEYLYRWLQSVAPDDMFVRKEDPLELDDGTDPEPDLALIVGRFEDTQRRHPTGDQARLVVEVADTTLRTDQMVKLPKYAQAGIPECWIVDLRLGTVTVHTSPSGGSYTDMCVLGQGETLQPTFAPNAVLVVGGWAKAP